MKKSLLALAVFSAFAGVASAQSSVILYGTLDLNGRYVKNDGSAKRLSLSTDGINSSQIGVRGVEDLGSGLKAGFVLLSGVNADTGTTNGKFWNRRSTVSLYSTGGEVRLGRDYLPTFWNQGIFDAFGANGLGEAVGVRQLWGGVRSDNSIGYFLPDNMGGFYGQAMASASEGGTTNVGSGSDRQGGRYIGARLGFAKGAFDAAVAYSDLRFGAATVVTSFPSTGALVFPVAPGQSQKTWNVGGSYDFGFLKLLAFYDHESIPNASEKTFSISSAIPFGLHEIRVGYHRSKLNRSSSLFNPTVDDVAATYQYNLSKRTAWYTTVSRLANKNPTQLTLGAVPTSATALPTPGGTSKGFELGVRHFF